MVQSSGSHPSIKKYHTSCKKALPFKKRTIAIKSAPFSISHRVAVLPNYIFSYGDLLINFQACKSELKTDL